MPSESSNRIYQIDLFRFLAALSVVLFHYLFRGYSADNMSDLNFSEIGHFFKYGYLGVQMFFIISGFVITLSISERSLTRFAISRFSRLYPIYWISVLLTFSIIVLFGAPRYTADLKQLLFNLTMFQKYFGVANLDGVYWTLFIEMKFYIFVIGLYLILNKWKEIKLDYLIYSWLSLSVMYLFFSDLSILKQVNRFFIFEWSSYFIAGIIFYQIYRNKLNFKYSTLLLFSFCISIYYAIPEMEEMAMQYHTTLSPYIVSASIAIFYLLMLLVSCKKLNRINYSGLRKIGMLTYPLYLIHQNIGFIIFNHFNTYINKYVLVIITVVLMLLTSFVLSEFYEPIVSKFLKTRLKSFAKNIIN